MTFMKRTAAAAAAVAVTAALFVSPGTASSATTREDNCSARCRRQLAIAKKATAKYQDFTEALRDGYLPVSGCTTAADEGHDAHEGTMGIHFVSSETDENDSFDQVLNVRDPEYLLYVPDKTGALRLVAIEYSVPVLVEEEMWRGPEPPPQDVEPPPQLFGRRFDGPMRGHDGVDLQPWHYDLHVWVWSRNPSGTFAKFNPREDCDPTTG
ncbi:MAG: hypothetical protein LC722_08550 [Actinobacteria bacterium]|nr:hypothetical protein [Actinomycetota bacterium]